MSRDCKQNDGVIKIKNQNSHRNLKGAVYIVPYTALVCGYLGWNKCSDKAKEFRSLGIKIKLKNQRKNWGKV